MGLNSLTDDELVTFHKDPAAFLNDTTNFKRVVGNDALAEERLKAALVKSGLPEEDVQKRIELAALVKVTKIIIEL